MKATIYVLSSALHWYKAETYDNVDDELFKNLQVYEEYYQGQVRIEYSETSSNK